MKACTELIFWILFCNSDYAHAYNFKAEYSLKFWGRCFVKKEVVRLIWSLFSLLVYYWFYLEIPSQAPAGPRASCWEPSTHCSTLWRCSIHFSLISDSQAHGALAVKLSTDSASSVLKVKRSGSSCSGVFFFPSLHCVFFFAAFLCVCVCVL